MGMGMGLPRRLLLSLLPSLLLRMRMRMENSALSLNGGATAPPLIMAGDWPTLRATKATGRSRTPGAPVGATKASPSSPSPVVMESVA